MEGHRFKYPADFDLQTYLAQGWQLQANGSPTEVVIRFDESVARWVSGAHWHASQRIEHEPEGTILFHVTVSGYEEMIYWVLSFGPQAEVLEPAALRAAVADQASRAAARYGAEPASGNDAGDSGSASAPGSERPGQASAPGPERLG